ncbi:MAG TPA: phosphate propanoyltransferase [Candidatus Staskawiczbacteria bacterium]|nr:phosphate propanoyltransferase [Candidatus Staskawiczbacteria bacterium]
MDKKIPVEVSARHCHLSKEDLEKLFGPGYELKILKQLSQPSDFAAVETVTIEFGSKKFENVRIVGPTRTKTQVEISLTDAVGSGVVPPIRLSGDLKDSSPVVLQGPTGRAELAEGLIIAKNHIHCATMQAADFGISNGETVSIRINSERPITFHDVPVRVSDNYDFHLHIDTDEGNAAAINKIGEGIIIK